jgi:hypothetical protein
VKRVSKTLVSILQLLGSSRRCTVVSGELRMRKTISPEILVFRQPCRINRRGVIVSTVGSAERVTY